MTLELELHFSLSNVSGLELRWCIIMISYHRNISILIATWSMRELHSQVIPSYSCEEDKSLGIHFVHR